MGEGWRGVGSGDGSGWGARGTVSILGVGSTPSPHLWAAAKGGERLPSHILTHASRTLDVAHGDFIQGGTGATLLSRSSFFENCAMDG